MLTSRRVNRWLPLISAAVLVAGVITFMAVRNTGRPALAVSATSGKPQTFTASQKTVPMSSAARLVAGRFIETAVKRKNLTEAYALSGQAIREGQSLKQWLTGTIAVVPYLKPINFVTIHKEYSYPTEVLLKVIIVPKGNSRANTFYMQLNKFGKGAKGRWLVTMWQPHGSADIALPNN